MANGDDHEPVEVKNCMELVRHLDEQEIEMIVSAFAALQPECRSFDLRALALFRRDRLDVVIDTLFEAERRGLFSAEAARDLACKLMGLRDGLTP
jgi:hypothetical protein